MRLPQSLPEALGCFVRNDTATGWFPDDFADLYVKHKQGEMAFLEGWTQEEICSLYEQAYRSRKSRSRWRQSFRA